MYSEFGKRFWISNIEQGILNFDRFNSKNRRFQKRFSCKKMTSCTLGFYPLLWLFFAY
jgi:hypothetical protein